MISLILSVVLALTSAPPVSTTEARVYRVLMQMAPHKTDLESTEERSRRMRIIARAIDRAANRAACIDQVGECRVIYADANSMRRGLVTIGRFESHFAQYVHEDRCAEGPYKCDIDKDGNPRAKSVFQIWRVAVQPRDDWSRIGGTTQEATDLAAWNAARLFAGARPRCRSIYPQDPMAGAFAGYAGGCLTLSPAKLWPRVRFYNQIQI